jgi:hypothetical protein
MPEHLASTKTNRLTCFIQGLVDHFLVSKKTVFDLTHQEIGKDYFFESSHQGAQGYLTIQCENIKPGVHILLCVNDVPQRYEVREVSFYASPEGMCTALLARISK